MKKKLLSLAIMTILFCSWTINDVVNTNSWVIRIGKKDLLSSAKNNKIGDTVLIDKKKIKLTDSLYAGMYLCGYSGQNSVTTLKIKDQQNKVIKEVINKNDQLTFSAKIPASEVFVLNSFNSGEIFSVFLSIESNSEEINQTYLLGRLRSK
jgi:hypothetical protein